MRVERVALLRPEPRDAGPACSLPHASPTHAAADNYAKLFDVSRPADHRYEEVRVALLPGSPLLPTRLLRVPVLAPLFKSVICNLQVRVADGKLESAVEREKMPRPPPPSWLLRLQMVVATATRVLESTAVPVSFPQLAETRITTTEQLARTIISR